MALTLEQGRRLIDVAIAKANELGVKLSFAVVDEHGGLVAASRMDGARGFTPDVARGKAMAAAVWGREGKQLADMVGSAVSGLVSNLYGGRFVYGLGGVLLKQGDAVVGAIGASGARPEQDEEAAKAGAAAL